MKMRLKIKYADIKKFGMICFLCIYFTTKLLWDTIPYVFELFSIGMIAYGGINAFTTNMHKRGTLVVLYISLSIYILISAFLQDSQNQIQRALYEYIFYMFIFWGTYYWGRHAKIEDWAIILLVIGIVVSCLSWLEYLTHHYLLTNTIEYVNPTTFRTIVFSRTFLAHGMVITFFTLLAIYKYITEKKKLFLFLSIFFFLTIFTTGSRGPLVACLVGIYIMFFLYETTRYGFTLKKFIFLFLTIFGFIFVIFILLSDFQVGNSIVDYFLNRFRSILNWSTDDGNTGRISIWNYYFKIFKENFWLGVGPSQTGSWNLSGKYGVTESGILKRLCELGIIGALLHYMLVFNIFFMGIKKLKNYKNDLNLIFYLSLFIAVFVDDITLQATEEIIVSYLMWFALAGIENSYNRKKFEVSK